MRISISKEKARESIWAWLFWDLGTYLVLELGTFFIVGSVLKKTTGELAGPYLVCAVPAVVFMPLVWWLRKWEERGALPKRLAIGWSLSVVLLVVAGGGAFFYSGVKLGLMDSSNVVSSFIVMSLFGGLILYFSMYHRALTVISSRASGKPGR